MSKKLISYSSETGKQEVTIYGELSPREIEKRICAYEKKYGMTYPRYNRQFDCDSALPWETGDLMDWENLVEEKKDRSRKPGGKREMAYQKG